MGKADDLLDRCKSERCNRIKNWLSGMASERQAALFNTVIERHRARGGETFSLKDLAVVLDEEFGTDKVFTESTLRTWLERDAENR